MQKVYNHIFHGKTVGENLRQVRSLIKNNPKYGATSASFILYGDQRLKFVEKEIDTFGSLKF